MLFLLWIKYYKHWNATVIKSHRVPLLRAYCLRETQNINYKAGGMGWGSTGALGIMAVAPELHCWIKYVLLEMLRAE